MKRNSMSFAAATAAATAIALAFFLVGCGFPFNTDSPVAVSGVTVSPGTASIAVAGTQQLTATVLPSTATNKSVAWTVSPTGIATVSSSGLVTGTAAGNATVTATTVDGGRTATCAVTVTGGGGGTVAVTGVTVSPGTASIAVAGTQQLTATIAPSTATNQSVAWSVSPTGVATVSSSGLVTGSVAGNATVTATTADGSFTSTCAVTVTGGGAAGGVYAAKTGDSSYTKTSLLAIPADARFIAYGHASSMYSTVFVAADNTIWGGTNLIGTAYIHKTSIPAIPTTATFFSSDPFSTEHYYYIDGTDMYEYNGNTANPAWVLKLSAVPANTKFFNVRSGWAFCVDTDGSVKTCYFGNGFTNWISRAALAIPASAKAFYGMNSQRAIYVESDGTAYHCDGGAYSLYGVPAVPAAARFVGFDVFFMYLDRNDAVFYVN
ncbi:MAG: Ig-like domain-containing protein [Spirochaetaceae bacterium]|nr:Ig-like domain-containing protein [Spirochaetaceae bacterium]